MTERTKAVIVRCVLATVIVVPCIFGVLIVQSSPNSDAVVVTGPVSHNEPESTYESENSINIWFQVTSFDPETSKAKFNVYPWPTSDLAVAFSSSTISGSNFELFVDELYGAGTYQFRDGDRIGAIPIELDVLSIPQRGSHPDTFYYPFDSYVLDAYAGASNISANGERSDRAAFDYFYETSVSGFRTTYTRIAGWSHYDSSQEVNKEEILKERGEGNLSFLARFDRTWAVRFAVLMMVALWIINCISIVWTTYGVLRQSRPPSIQALIWAAASVIGSLQIRELFPGSPPLGIALDYFVFFPSLLINMLVVLVITASWSRRADFKL